jgi:primosomal protein N'
VDNRCDLPFQPECRSSAHTCWQPIPKPDQTIIEKLRRAPRQKATWELMQTHTSGATEVALKALGAETSMLKKLADKGLIKTYTHVPKKRPFHSYNPILKTSELTLNHEQRQALEAITCSSDQFSTTLLHGVTGSVSCCL